MSNNIRLRFAPSPTGYVHIGSLWGALFVYLIAKSLDGKIILRIEDTDQERRVKGAVSNLIRVLSWAGIEFDESPEKGGPFAPYIQTERLDIYKKYAEELIQKKEAYYCFCSKERLAEMRAKQNAEKLPPRYDGLCAHLSSEEIEVKLKEGAKYVIRQKMPQEGEVVVHDELRGEIKFQACDLDDHVLMKANGIPTYHLASVVDDHEMQISHVTRGQEWLPSFPKNILLYKSFGWEAPKFIHLPVILDKAGGKLSKRKGNVAVEDYIQDGYLPEALINFCALMGWHPKDDNEELTIDEIISKFKIEDMGISSPVFDIEKLDYFNGLYIRKKPLTQLVEACKYYLEKYWQDKERSEKISKKFSKFSDKFIENVVRLEQERMRRLSEIGELTKFFFLGELDYDQELLIWKKLSAEDVKVNLEKTYELLDKIPEENWTNDSIEDCLITYLKAKEFKVGDYLWPMRVSLTGEKASPSPFDVAEVLGKKITLERIEKAAQKLKT